MSANDIANKLGITHQSASSLIRSFEEMGIFREITGRKRPPFCLLGIPWPVYEPHPSDEKTQAQSGLTSPRGGYEDLRILKAS